MEIDLSNYVKVSVSKENDGVYVRVVDAAGATDKIFLSWEDLNKLIQMKKA